MARMRWEAARQRDRLREAPSSSPLVVAAFRSKCGLCRRRISPGEAIRASGPGKWQHSDCPQKPEIGRRS